MTSENKQVNKIVATYDYTAGTVEVQGDDTVLLTGFLGERGKNIALNKAIFSSDIAKILLITKKDELIALDAPLVGDTAPLGGMKVVYLDNIHWKDFHQAYDSPENIGDSEIVEAYTKLLNYAVEGKIILPLSYTHLVESSWSISAHNHRILGEFMLAMSSGWQMINPVFARFHDYGFYPELVKAADKLKFEPFSLDQYTYDFSKKPGGVDFVHKSDNHYIQDQMHAAAHFATQLFEGEYKDIVGVYEEIAPGDYIVTARLYADHVLADNETLASSYYYVKPDTDDKAELHNNILYLIEELDKEFKQDLEDDE